MKIYVHPVIYSVISGNFIEKELLPLSCRRAAQLISIYIIIIILIQLIAKFTNDLLVHVISKSTRQGFQNRGSLLTKNEMRHALQFCDQTKLYCIWVHSHKATCKRPYLLVTYNHLKGINHLLRVSTFLFLEVTNKRHLLLWHWERDRRGQFCLHTVRFASVG